MFYKKIEIQNGIIEVHKNWAGRIKVTVNGNLISERMSPNSSSLDFILIEEDRNVNYQLVIKYDSFGEPLFDIFRDDVRIKEDLQITYGATPEIELNKFKIIGINYLKNFEFFEAIEAFNLGLEYNPNDPEIYFHLACCYSINENSTMAFESLKKAGERNFNNKKAILNSEMLAFIRIQEGFDDFLKSNF